MSQKQTIALLVMFSAIVGVFLVPNVALAKKSHHSSDSSPPPSASPTTMSGFSQPPYTLTVVVPSHPFGDATVHISIKTENGFERFANPPTAGTASATFNIPQNQGSRVVVCVWTGLGLLHGQNCQTFSAGSQVVSMSAPSD